MFENESSYPFCHICKKNIVIDKETGFWEAHYYLEYDCGQHSANMNYSGENCCELWFHKKCWEEAAGPEYSCVCKGKTEIINDDDIPF